MEGLIGLSQETLGAAIRKPVSRPRIGEGGGEEGMEPVGNLRERIARLPWGDVCANLWSVGYGRMGSVLTGKECEEIRGLYDKPEMFRSRVNMERYRFGRGEYQYFRYPLPREVATLRESLYGFLADTAKEWMEALSLRGDFPRDLDGFLKKCKAQEQVRPTPLLLRYRAGDFNCLHQDVYGEIVFPFQVIFCLSRRDVEFTGGELLLVEQRPRAQSIGHAIHLEQGEGVVITTRYRPVKGSRGFYRANFRHGVSPVLSGERYTLGIIFHDAA